MTDAPIGIGHNNPPEPTPLALLIVATAAANTFATEIKEIKTEEEAEAAKTHVETMRQTWKAADNDRKAKNKPHDDAIESNNNTFRKPLKDGEDAAKLLKKLGGDYLAKKQREIDEAKAKAAAEAKEKLRLEEEAQRRLDEAAKSGDTTAIETASAAVTEANAKRLEAEHHAKPQKAKISGGGRGMSLTRYWYADITDIDKAFNHYKNYETVKAAIRNAVANCALADAQSFKDVDLAPPGISFRFEDKAK